MLAVPLDVVTGNVRPGLWHASSLQNFRLFCARRGNQRAGNNPVTISPLLWRVTSQRARRVCSLSKAAGSLRTKAQKNGKPRDFGLEWSSNHEPRERTRRSTEARKGEHGRTPGRVHRHFISSLPHERGGRGKGQKTAGAKMTVS
jgi:hypothetical protein